MMAHPYKEILNNPQQYKRNLTANYIEILKIRQCKNCSDQISINTRCLENAVIETVNDIIILLIRRFQLIGTDSKGNALPTVGKIAGTIIFRFARNHIIQLNAKCSKCKDLDNVQSLNLQIAILMAFKMLGISIAK